MNRFQQAIQIFPENLKNSLSKVSFDVQQRVQEIRLRSGQAVILGYAGCEQYITLQGGICICEDNTLMCLDEWIRQTIDTLCEGSFYAHQEEWKNGFLTTPDGCRVGIAGTAVMQQGKIVGYRDITALCVRVAREHKGCADVLRPHIYDGTVHSLLVCGEPSSGKTSVLKDVIRLLKTERLSVSVVDERGELSRNITGCDVLKFATKTEGLEQVIRCLSPQVVVFDELGGKEEWESVKQGMLRGVPTITSVHCQDPRELLCRDGKELLHSGVFEYIAILKGRKNPGVVDAVYKTKEWLNENTRVVAGDDNRFGNRMEHKTITKQAYPLIGMV